MRRGLSLSEASLPSLQSLFTPVSVTVIVNNTLPPFAITSEQRALPQAAAILTAKLIPSHGLFYESRIPLVGLAIVPTSLQGFPNIRDLHSELRGSACVASLWRTATGPYPGSLPQRRRVSWPTAQHRGSVYPQGCNKSACSWRQHSLVIARRLRAVAQLRTTSITFPIHTPLCHRTWKKKSTVRHRSLLSYTCQIL